MSIASPDLDRDYFDAIVCNLSSADLDISTFGERAQRISDAVVFVAQAETTMTDKEQERASVLLRKPVGSDSIAMKLADLRERS